MVSLVSTLIVLLLTQPQAVASENIDPLTTPHFTLILHQIRGSECCDPGNLTWFTTYQSTLAAHNLVGNFALRYDVLTDSEYLSAINNDATNQYGALLEITPQLAKDAGVAYKTDASRWYEAQNAHLIGYTQSERRQLIDRYMSQFHDSFGYYPQFSSAWMIDAWSLSYLKAQYGVQLHQLTREQFGTDSYTLYGGPPHYPYYPSPHWALVPVSEFGGQPVQMPLVVRQTITDPVYNYGDKSNSYTSQPNDYQLRGDSIEYFKHLLTQAHGQSHDYTFALIGLENSMPEPAQQEYLRQLSWLGEWQRQQPEIRLTPTTSQLAEWRAQHPNPDVVVYSGQAQHDPAEKAWWITTPTYRARVRLSSGELSITDLRLYHEQFFDPYYTQPATSWGWWIVPFSIDGSRFFESTEAGVIVKNDYLKDRPNELGRPSRLVIATGVTSIAWSENSLLVDDQPSVSFATNAINFQQPAIPQNLDTSPKPLEKLLWQAEPQAAWGFTSDANQLLPFVTLTDLGVPRQQFRQLLFPETQFEPLDSQQTTLYVNNARSLAGRNPVRLVLFPKNNQGEPILLPKYPRVITDPPVTDVSFYEQHRQSGMVFIDLNHDQPLMTTVTVQYDTFESQLKVYFAPNCKTRWWHCMTHPNHAWWYGRNWLDDKLRARREARQNQAEFVQ